MSRTRTISWHDPVDAARQAEGLTGLEALHRIGNGLLPPPPVADLVGFHPIFVMPGYVVFAYEPREEHYNTLGAVHGGILTTVLDTVMGCADPLEARRRLRAGHDRAEDELRPAGHARVRARCAPRGASSIPARASPPPRRSCSTRTGRSSRTRRRAG